MYGLIATAVAMDILNTNSFNVFDTFIAGLFRACHRPNVSELQFLSQI
jgi:hypothetical protein